jgi:hypothetical protein
MSRKAFLLRIDEKLYQDLEEWAQQEMRSVNGQIEYLLKQSLLKLKGASGHLSKQDSIRQPTVKKR